MSELIRYHMMWNKDEDGSIYVSPWPSALSGDWVKYEDYARLKAEVERLKTHSFTAEELTSMKAEAEFLHAQFKRDLFNQVVEENARLKADVERLNNLIISGGAVNPDASVYIE